MKIFIQDLLYGSGTAGFYNAGCQLFLMFLLGFLSFFYNAPFGKFLPSKKGWLIVVPGRVGWVIQETVPLIVFPLVFFAPHTSRGFVMPSLNDVTNVLSQMPFSRLLAAALYLMHYLNRGPISTIRNPSRNHMAVFVVCLACVFTSLNSALLAIHLNSLSQKESSSPLLIICGTIIFLFGFASNIYHDEVLYELKRQQKGYGIPRGGLYDYPFGGVSHAAYFSEWIEWAGFLLVTLSFSSPSFAQHFVWLQAPSIFLINEVFTMLPRAVNGHKWYRANFANYPPARRAIIPGVL